MWEAVECGKLCGTGDSVLVHIPRPPQLWKFPQSYSCVACTRQPMKIDVIYQTIVRAPTQAPMAMANMTRLTNSPRAYGVLRSYMQHKQLRTFSNSMPSSK